MGARALAAAAKAHDGRGAETLLLEAVTQHLGLSRPEDMIRCGGGDKGLGKPWEC